MRESVKATTVAILGSDVALAPRLRWLARRKALTVLNLHRVDDRGESTYAAMDPYVFADLLRWLRTNFVLTTFEELGELTYDPKPPLVLSFDDGYRDFIEVVAPILAAQGVKANQNVIPGCIDLQRPPNSVILQDFIGGAPAQLLREVRVPGFPRLDPARRVVSGRAAAAFVKSRPMADQNRVMSQLAPYLARHDAFETTPMMTRAEIREMASVHEVGAHSYEHATMTMESDAYLRDDVARCGEYFDAAFQCQPAVYAFPNGVARQMQTQIVHDAGFAHVLLTGLGFGRPPDWLHSRRLVYGASRGEARFRAVGAFEPRARATSVGDA